MFSSLNSGRLRKRLAPAMEGAVQRLTLGNKVLPTMPQPGFNINTAMNTFNQQLGARVASGQMTMDQARAAQAEMTALQRMPSATREQATDVAQRQMQVGQYAPTPVTPPMPQGGLTLSNVPQRLTLSNTPPPMEDIVVQPMRPAPQADTGFNINTAMNTFNQSLGDRVASGQMSLDQARAAQAEMTALQRTANPTREQATDVAQRQMQVGQYSPQPARELPKPSPMPKINAEAGIPLWMRLGPGPERDAAYAAYQAGQNQPMALPGGTGYDERGNMLPQKQPRGVADMLRGMPMMPSQPPQVDNSTFVSMPNFRMPTAPQPLPSNAQAMAMGGLMRKYGGMC
jgi:polyhydroxyalkanoate synthesis regulator phasin